MGTGGGGVLALSEGAPGVDVTVKIRRGRHMGREVAPEFARAMEDAGAAAVAVHGRFATQMYRGEADWGVLDRVADAVGIPVIASGGVGTLEHFAEGIVEGEADAVLAASVFHFGTYTIREVKEYMASQGIPVRLDF